ncbi:hypothetical protein H7J70_05435 [Mycolicibacterium celeriflavum]|uniref:Uncharacterized protein n=1 Tax=Mycolicibacterium celeriflavum TaxID=1249101 RepID=A0A1X0BUU2_MYCCF|nr:hypothetical protein [Mycolicibacterium celeriflavum]ORA47771.1 hypothetical protein BST21_11490 [Mycolicibacterium celeriflavum]BBY45829.1 hypothetical protein MCEL_41240 [Mycolicibacterium celeriflavum]
MSLAAWAERNGGAGEVVVVDSVEVDDDLVREMTAVLTRCAGFCGNPAAGNGTTRAMTAAAVGDCEAG